MSEEPTIRGCLQGQLFFYGIHIPGVDFVDGSFHDGISGADCTVDSQWPCKIEVGNFVACPFSVEILRIWSSLSPNSYYI